MTLFPDRLRFGIHAGPQYTDFPAYLELWRTAEQLGLDWASVFDHFLPIQTDPTGPCFECLTMLAAMAAHTERIACGIIVTGVTYRQPAVLANMAVTIDHVSGGRLELGLGAAWNELEHDQYGIPFPPMRERLQMLGEAAGMLKSLWREPTTTFQGRHYTLREARCEPKPLRPEGIPLWIGGAGERVTLRHVAAHADGWNTFLMPEDQYRHKVEVLARHCADAGRDPATIRRQLIFQAVLGADEREAQEQLAARATALRAPVDALREQAMAVTPEQLATRLAPYVALGVQDFLISARPPMDRRTLELFSGEVAGALRG